MALILWLKICINFEVLMFSRIDFNLVMGFFDLLQNLLLVLDYKVLELWSDLKP